jgi:hypothetical protein
MKIFLIEAVDLERGADVEVLYPPMGLAYLAGFCLKKHSEWEFRFARGGELNGADIYNRVKDFRPDVVGIGFDCSWWSSCNCFAFLG